MPHPIAIAGFSTDAERYEAGRPGYPGETIREILRFAGGAERIVDLGAGTGKLTRLLPASTTLVVAVDPVAQMTRIAREAAPLAHIVTAAAETLPFATASIDCVTVAQAFHWFDQEQAWIELGRVVRPGGAVASIANRRLREVEWIDQLWTLMDEFERDAPWRQDRPTPRARWSADFHDPVRMRFRHTVPMTEETIVARVSSVSHVAVLDDRQRSEIERRARDIARSVPIPLEIEYEAELALFRRS